MDKELKESMGKDTERALHEIDIEINKISLILGNIRDNQGFIDYYDAQEVIDSLAKVRVDLMSRWRRL